MRQGLVQAIHHAAHRATFGKRLLAHPLMQNVLADLALETTNQDGRAVIVGSATARIDA